MVVLSFYEGEIVSPWSFAVMCENGLNILEGIFVRFSILCVKIYCVNLTMLKLQA